jgi:hypothetical protein
MPGRPRSARRGIDTGLVQDVPDRGGGDVVAEPDQFALHAPVSPARVLSCQADDELLDCRRGGGRPGWRRAVWSHFHETSLRCQARTVAGVTGRPRPAATRQQPG